VEAKGIRVFFLARISDNLKKRMETSNMDQSKIKLFEDQPIRTAWDEEYEEWYFFRIPLPDPKSFSIQDDTHGVRLPFVQQKSKTDQ